MPANILPYIEEGRSFDDTATQAMGEAYHKVRQMLRDKGQPQLVQEVIAKRIIDIASVGERDPDELARKAFIALGSAE